MAEEEQQQQHSAALQVQVLGAPPVVDDGTMEEIIEKLKLLNYDLDFCPKSKPPFKLLTRTQFTQPADNANAQFFYFTSLVSWLMSCSGHNGFPPPGQFDDPNASATNILTEMRAMNLPVQNWPPNRIRQGHGDAVMSILVLLCDRALLSRGFNFLPVEYVMERAEIEENFDSQGGGVGGATGDDDAIEDHVDVDSDSEDEVYQHVGGSIRHKDETTEMIQPQVSAEAWHLEVERVAPRLQLRMDEVRDWRARIENAETLLKAVEKMYPDVKVMLDRMGDDLSKSKDLIQKREISLVSHFTDQVTEYRDKLRELNVAQDAVSLASSNVAQLSAEQNRVSEMLDQVKQEIEDREAKFADTDPLNKIKAALQKVKTETKEMSLRIGVLQHTVLHYALRQAKSKKEGGGRGPDMSRDEDSFIL